MGATNVPVIVPSTLLWVPCVALQPGESLGRFGGIRQETDLLTPSFSLVLAPSISPSNEKHLAFYCQK